MIWIDMGYIPMKNELAERQSTSQNPPLKPGVKIYMPHVGVPRCLSVREKEWWTKLSDHLVSYLSFRLASILFLPVDLLESIGVVHRPFPPFISLLLRPPSEWGLGRLQGILYCFISQPHGLQFGCYIGIVFHHLALLGLENLLDRYSIVNGGHSSILITFWRFQHHTGHVYLSQTIHRIIPVRI